MTGIFCFLATGTKEIIIICPLLLVSIDWFFIAQGDWTTFKKRLSIYSFFFLVSVGILMVFLKPSFFLGGEFLTKFTHNNAGNTITNHYYDPIRPLQFFISEFQVILHYIFIFFWPFNISVEYDYKIIGSPLHVSCIVPLAFLILALYYTFKMLKLDPKNPICFGVIWFFLGLMLRSTIIPSPEMINDYKTYLSSIGILFLISSGVIKALLACCRKRERRKNCIVAFYIILIASLGFLTYRRNLVWSNKIKFWENALQQAPNKARTNNNYGVHLSENNQSGKATVFFKKAIKLDPYYPNPYNNLAMHYAYSGQTEKAIDLLKKCVQINPNYPEPYNNLSALLYQKGNLKLAEEIATQGRKTNKFYGRFDYTLGKIHAKKNDFLNAYRHFKICCTKKDFTNETGFSSYGFTALKLKKYDEAIFAYKQALEYKPNVTDFLANIGTAYFHKKQYEQAVFYFKKALKNSPKKLSIIFYLAETYLKAKNYKKALEQYQKCFSIEKKHSYPLKMELCLKKLGHRVEAQNIHNLLKQ
ncbi:tetratricopeptide repeat protein [bacterium]|nr:tetratricopeptide repeat protein [bacterium]